MTLSMTAFARQEEQTDDGSIIWEIRSVNHRYLEVSLRLEEQFRPLEMQIRKRLTDKLGRGKIDANLRYKTPEKQASLEFDQNRAQSVIDGYQQLAQLADDTAPMNMLDVLKWPGVIVTETPDNSTLNKAISTLLDKAIEDLISSRETEGAALQKMIEQRCEEIDLIAHEIRQAIPHILQQQRIRLMDRITDLKLTLDETRLEQEVALLAQKSDIAEELDRLQSHIVEVKNVLKRKEPIGRRLDFLMQELHREVNTLASKSIDSDMTRNSVDLKVLIEQMREQVQNIE